MNEKALRELAMQRIKTLFQLARQVYAQDPQLAQRYVEIARRIAMSAKIRLPKEYKRQICRRCKSFIHPGINCRVRIKQKREPHVVITCLKCGRHTRIPLRGKKESMGKNG